MDRGNSPHSVADTVWNWRESQVGKSHESAASLRTRALVQGVIGGVVGTGVYCYLSPSVGLMAWTLSGLITLVGLISPLGLFQNINASFEWFGSMVGIAMAWLLLVPVYYLFFTPFRLLFRRGKNDAMTRWLDKEADTYWVHREESNSKESYERQF